MNRALLFGEVLFDCLPSGEEILGGAPFNVAWNLQGFGANPLMLSRVGRDQRGDRILQRMDEWKMDTSGIQRDPELPTGVAEITLTDGHAEFELPQGQAYDNIQAIDLKDHEQFALLYHGTLALRNSVSSSSLYSLRQRMEKPVLVDLNLRAPWWDLKELNQYLRDVKCLKISDEELDVVSNSSHGDTEKQIAAARRFAEEYDIEQVIVTCGSEGAFLVDRESLLLQVKPPKLEDFVDTVGAGDAFTSVVIFGQLSNWDENITLERAAHFAASVCEISGATTKDVGLYQRHRESWN